MKTDKERERFLFGASLSNWRTVERKFYTRTNQQ